ncbi:MAG: hypothetical protein JWL69_3118 [Phycisphaerales bacterium]|nr:hypothetical protein [Phycisphaerales bacterium]
MRWRVEGADKATGKDKTIQVEALDADAAVLCPEVKGMLVASVRPASVAQSIPYATPAKKGSWTAAVRRGLTAMTAEADPRSLPQCEERKDYHTLKRACTSLGSVASLAKIIGVICIVSAPFIGYYGETAANSRARSLLHEDYAAAAERSSADWNSWAAAKNGVWCIALGYFLAAVAAAGEPLIDIAEQMQAKQK